MKAVNCLATVLSLGFTFGSQGALAAPLKKGSSSSSSSSGGKSDGRDWLISLPLMAERPQFRIHAEYNAGGSLGLAFEGAMISSVEELSQDEVLETGNSLNIRGAQASVLMSRYSDASNMGGFFWTVGAGYRAWTAEWKKRPDTQEATRLSLVDDYGFLHHRAEGKGVTGHGRVGYRYVASEWPLAVGAHFGLRHMNSQVRDVEITQEEQSELQLNYSDLTDKERNQLKHKMMTTPDFTVDFGFVF